MSWKNIRWYIRYYSQFFPFTINTLLCLLAAYVGYRILYQPYNNAEPQPFRPFIILMGKLAFWFVITIILASIVSTLISWIYYIYLQKKKGTQLQLAFSTKTKNGKKTKLFMDAELHGAKRPLLGFVKGRLLYDDNEMTDKFSLLSNKHKKGSIIPISITGRSRLQLPDIKEYNLKGGLVFFQDMLHLFSLAAPQALSGQFHQPPVFKGRDEKDVAPKKTEDTDVRIDELRRIDGEYLNYKNFEAGDDVRRIVWKVYAKNRELVVRIPERFQPFASHLYFYASFHADIKKQWLNDGYLKEMLNYYKNHIWTVYDTLASKDFAMRYIPDQEFKLKEQLTENQKAQRIISNSSWQQDTSLQQYFDPKQGTVLCISSLTDIEELQQVLDNCNESTIVYYVKLSRAFKHIVAWGWLKRLMLLPPKDRLNKLRTKWTFSTMRYRIRKREKEIEVILQKHSVACTTL